MKKFIALFACFCLILSQFSITAFAASFDLDYDYKEASVSISGQSVAGDDIDIIVFKTGDEMLPENCIHVNQVKCDEDGKFNITFLLPSSAVSDEYTVYLSGKDKVVKKATFNHNNVVFIISSLKNAETVSQFKSVLANNSSVFSAEFVAAPDAVIDLVLGSSFDSISDYEKYFANKTKLYNFSIADASGMKAIYDESGASLGLELLEDYTDLDDKTNVFYVAKQEGFDLKDITSVNDALKIGVIFTMLKDGGVIKLDAVVNYVKNNPGLFGITQAAADSASLSEALKSMLGTDVTTTKEFAEDLADAFDELDSSSSSSSSRPSSGGGGGGGSVKGGSGKVPVVVAPAAEPVKKNFTDLNNVPWAVEAITALADRDIVSGISATEFNPEANVTREQFVKMFVLALGITTDNATSDFADIPASHWSYPYVSGAVSAGVVNGMGNGNFGAGQNITRQDMAVMLYRAASISRIALTEKTTISFSDEAEMADYAKTAVETMSKAGIINGSDGKFMPGANATRAQAAKMIYELLKIKGGI